MTTLRIKVKPNSKVEKIILETDGSLSIKIKAPPVDGKANKYLIEFLSNYLDIPKSHIQLIKGESSPHKTIKVNATQEYINGKLLNP